MDTTFSKRLLRVILLFLGAAALLVGYLIFWNLTGIGFVCPFHELLGLSCPGCGITRALWALLRLDVVAALRYHPLILLILGYVGWYGGVSVCRYLKGERDAMDVRPYWVHFAFLGLLLAFGGFRLAWEILYT